MSHPWFLQRTLKLPRDCTSWPRSLVPARLSQVLWDFGPFVVDAAPCEAWALSEGLLATLVQDDDTELEEAATPHDQDFLLVTAIMTGWKCYEEGERDVDELVAAAVEAIEGDVTDHDMHMDLIQ